nr:hypothetical protein [Tanacetum cinerariifolium]
MTKKPSIPRRNKPKASAKRKRGGSDSSITPPTAVASPRPITTIAAALRLTADAKGKQPARVTSPTDPSEVERTEAEQLKIVLRRSRQETHISQQGGSSIDKGTGSKPGVPDVPFDDSDEEISWNSSDDEDVDDQDKGRDDNEGEKTDESDADNDDQDKAEKDKDGDDDDEAEIAKIDEQEATESGEGDDEETKSDGESEEEETREEEEERFDPIPRTPEDDEDDGNGKKDQGLRISEEERIQEEEEADELYRGIDINQGRGLQVSQDIEDSHVTLTPLHPDGQQKSSSVSSFVTSMLNPTIDAGVELIFMTASSPIAPLPTPTLIMTPSTIATITTSSAAPIPPTTIPSAVLKNLPTFDSVFRFEDRVKSLEVNFSKFMQTNQFAEAVSKIPDIVHQYMTQQMTEAVREAVQIQTDRLQDSFQRENDEFLCTADENMKKIIKGQVKSQVKEQVSRILPRIEESVNAQLEAEVLTRSSNSSRTSYAVAADLTEIELKKILIEKMEGDNFDLILRASASLGNDSETSNGLLKKSESELLSLKEEVSLLEMSNVRQRGDLEELEHALKKIKEEASKMKKKGDVLKTELDTVKEEKPTALNNEKLTTKRNRHAYDYNPTSQDSHKDTESEWKNKELELTDFVKQFKEENAALGKEIGKLTNILKETEESSALNEERSQIKNILKEAESKVTYLKKVLGKLVHIEASFEELNVELEAAKMFESYAYNLIEEWKTKVEELDLQAKEAKRLERIASSSLESVVKELETSNGLLKKSESELLSLKEEVSLLEMSNVQQGKFDWEQSVAKSRPLLK